MRLGQTVCTPDSTDILASENAITRKQGSESNNFGLASSASDNTDYPTKCELIVEHGVDRTDRPIGKRSREDPKVERHRIGELRSYLGLHET